jgi:hypothetical protein
MKYLALLALSTVLAATGTGAQAKSGRMKWIDASAAGLPAGAQMAVVSGDPSKAGPFVIRTKFPANYTVPPHHHPADEVVRVMSAGSLTYGMGDKVDTANSGTLSKGYHVTMQSGMNHWVMTSAPLELQVTGDGPFAIIYANPADDPRNAKK